MILVKICVEVLPQKRKEFEQAAQWLVKSEGGEKGNLLKTIYQELGNPNAFYYLEEWDTREHFEVHFHSDSFRALIGGMKVLGEITGAKIIFGAYEENLNVDQ